MPVPPAPPSPPTFRLAQAARLLGVSDDTIRRWADSGRFPTRTDPSGRRVVDGAALAGFAQELAVDAPIDYPIAESARNHFPGLVTRVIRDTVMAQVELQAGPYRVVSLLSREAADELHLQPGVLAVASVKSTNVVIELPDQTRASPVTPGAGLQPAAPHTTPPQAALKETT